MEGYKKALEDQGASHAPCIIQCSNDMESNKEIIRDLLKNKVRPDGIIASVEKLTTTVYMVCKELKLSIPSSIRVVSFTNLQTAAILNPALTTVTQPAFEMGELSMKLLLQLIESKRPVTDFETKMLSTELLIRGSTKWKKTPAVSLT